MDSLTAVLTSLSHPSRRAILEQLVVGPARFTDIAAAFHTAVNAVTKHLKLLERAGLIERTKKGREVFISLRAEPLQQVSTWVHPYERFWNQRLDEFAKNFGEIEDEKEKNDDRNKDN